MIRHILVEEAPIAKGFDSWMLIDFGGAPWTSWHCPGVQVEDRKVQHLSDVIERVSNGIRRGVSGLTVSPRACLIRPTGALPPAGAPRYTPVATCPPLCPLARCRPPPIHRIGQIKGQVQLSKQRLVGWYFFNFVRKKYRHFKCLGCLYTNMFKGVY